MIFIVVVYMLGNKLYFKFCFEEIQQRVSDCYALKVEVGDFLVLTNANEYPV